MKTYRRKNRKHEFVNTLTEAQKLAFAPLTFQAISTLLEWGILKRIDLAPVTLAALINEFDYSEYAISTLLEVAQTVELVEKREENFYISSLGKAFLYDEMTRVNFNFVKDVCYNGAQYLSSSLVEEKPNGLRTIFKDAETIYPYLSVLPQDMRQSWYEFDHYYSDNCFECIYSIISKGFTGAIYDIGGNMGAFEKVCLKHNPDCDITMIDLAENIDFISADKELQKCKFLKVDMLATETNFPQMSGRVLMSQFLDCFSKSQIVQILKKIVKSSTPDTKIYILEPFIDNQRFKGAELALIHTSLYFTCMANGYSKMYSKREMVSLIEQAGLRVQIEHENIGRHDYTLLECVKNG